MEMFSSIHNSPDNLYNLSVSATVLNYGRHCMDVRSLPENVQFDVYFKVSVSAAVSARVLNFIRNSLQKRMTSTNNIKLSVW